MHVKCRRICTQQVVVYCGDLQPAIDQLRHHRVDFSFKKDEVAHNHRAAMCWLESDPAAEGQRRFDSDAIERY